MDVLSPAKLLVILVVALAVLGPDKLPTLAKQVGNLWRDFSRFRQKLESDVRASWPDLPSTETIAKAVRAPVSFLDTLADAPPEGDGTLSESPATGGTAGPPNAAPVAADGHEGTYWPTETVIGSEAPAPRAPVLITGAVGVVHEVRPAVGGRLHDPGSN